ncbi:MAG: hypothetical protein AAGK02_17315 [Pseudomonadota bacterium]
MQQRPTSTTAASAPAASDRLKPRQKMVGHNPSFVKFYVGKGDAKTAANGGHRASAHRRIQPVEFIARIGKSQSMLVGMPVANCAVGQTYPNLTLKRGTMVIEVEDATVTHCGESETAYSIPLENATVADLRIEQLNR